MTFGRTCCNLRTMQDLTPKLIAALALTGLATHIVLRFTTPDVANVPLMVIVAIGGAALVYGLVREVVRGNFGADFLAAIAIVTAGLLGEWLAGAIVVLMLSGGEVLESMAVGRANRMLDALARRMPSVAHREADDGTLVDVGVEEVEIGDRLVVLPHESCPVDGVVVAGHGAMDESYLTGEPYRVSKTPGVAVLSGAVNGESALTIEATSLARDSRYARIMEVMEGARQARPEMRRLADRLGAWYAPLAVAVGIAAWVAAGDPIRFLAVMVIATPCPLLIAIPVAILGAINLAARHSIVIRDPRVLEQIDGCRTLILDKTGTLTLGRPSVTDVHVGAWPADEVVRLAASVEVYSKHPLATAIVAEAKRRGLELDNAEEVREPPGQGLTAAVSGHTLRITSRNALSDQGHDAAREVPPMRQGLECVVLVDDTYGGTFVFHDEPRADGRPFVEHLATLHNFDRVMLVSGDRESEVAWLAKRVGITEIHAQQTPEQKVAIVEAETKRARTVFVGDGINDAPALMTATVGIAFGQANEITSEAAGAVIMEPSLRHLDELFHIATRLRRIALQSAVAGMALSIVGMGFAAFGFLTPVAGAILQEGIDLVSVLNALRVPIRRGELSDIPPPA